MNATPDTRLAAGPAPSDDLDLLGDPLPAAGRRAALPAAHAPARDARLRPREISAIDRAVREATDAGLAQALIDSPVGPLLAVAGEAGLHALYFLDPGQQVATPAPDGRPGEATIERLRDELRDYFAGARHRFDVPLAPRGTPFQEAVWRRLLDIDCGRTETYGRIARDVGRPGASRAVGLAVGRNPISILVPCHRVIGEDGTLTGYSGGLPRKRFLLALELGPETIAWPDAR